MMRADPDSVHESSDLSSFPCPRVHIGIFGALHYDCSVIRTVPLCGEHHTMMLLVTPLKASDALSVWPSI